MAESNSVEQRKCVVIEDVDDSVSVKDIKAHFLKRSNGGNGSEFHIDALLRFEDDAVADAVLKKSHSLGSRKVGVHAYNQPISCVQEYTQKDFKNVLIIRGIEGIDERDLMIYFMSVENGGNGKKFKFDRIASDSATLTFPDSEVTVSLLDKKHEIVVGDEKHQVDLYRPHDKVIMIVEGSVDSKSRLDPWLMRSLTNRFEVDIKERDNSAHITGSLQEMAAVQAFLKSEKVHYSATALTTADDQPADCPDEAEQNESFKRTIVVRGIQDLSDDEVLLHFILVENGGCGKKPQYRRIKNDVAELQFEDQRAAKNFLRRTNTIKVKGGERSVRVERPVGEVLDNVRAKLSPTVAADERLMKYIKKKFQVKVTTTNDKVFISGSFAEVERVHEFLEAKRSDVSGGSDKGSPRE